MKNCRILLSVMMVAVASLVFTGCSALGTQPQIKAEVVMKTGEQLRLFYGGTKEAKETFCPGEEVTVYRAYPQRRLRYVQMGKVKIVRVLDEHYLEGVVTSGPVKDGDIAMKASASCLVRPMEPKEE